MQGDVVCTSDGKSVSFLVERNADADTYVNTSSSQSSEVQEIIQYDTGTSGSGDRFVTEDSYADETTSGGSDNSQGMDEGIEGTYILNSNTHKFHIPTCSSVSQMKEKNKGVYEGSRDDIIQQGYVPCKKCNP